MIKVTASYIVKNEEEYLPYSIASIYNVVDEIIVVDNGSTDRTVEIAQSFPKVKIFYSQTENFSELRNLSLEKSTGDWIMIMCADEVFYDDINEVLPRLVAEQDVDGYICWFYHLMRSPYYMVNTCDHDRRFQRLFLVRNIPGMKYVKPVHQYLTGIGPNIRDSQLHYVHYGYVKPAAFIYEKLKKYSKLENKPFNKESTPPEQVVDDQALFPFYSDHPRAIREFIVNKSLFECQRGNKLFCRPPFIKDWEAEEL